MKTCVDFRVIGKAVKPLEEATREDFDSYSEFALSLQNSIALSLETHGVKVNKIESVKGCAVRLFCDIDSVRISCILSIVLEDQSVFRCAIANWGSPPIWKTVLHLMPTEQQETKALTRFCRILDSILRNDISLDAFRWWTLEEWHTGKYLEGR